MARRTRNTTARARSSSSTDLTAPSTAPVEVERNEPTKRRARKIAGSMAAHREQQDADRERLARLRAGLPPLPKDE